MRNRDKTFQVRIDENERAMIEALAEREGLTASDVVRVMIRREHAKTIAKPEPRAKGRAR